MSRRRISPTGLANRVRYLPSEGELAEEFRWLKRCDRLPQLLREEEARLKGGPGQGARAGSGLAGWAAEAGRASGTSTRTSRASRHGRRIGCTGTTAWAFHSRRTPTTCSARPIPTCRSRLEELMRAARFVVAVSDYGARDLRERFSVCRAQGVPGVQRDRRERLSRWRTRCGTVHASWRWAGTSRRRVSMISSPPARCCETGAWRSTARSLARGPLQEDLAARIAQVNLRGQGDAHRPEAAAGSGGTAGYGADLRVAVRGGSGRRDGQPAHGHH